MELNDFIANFANQFDETDPSEIKSDTVFKELDEWSSMMGMAVIAMVKKKYSKIITGNDVRQCETVEELFNCVASK